MPLPIFPMPIACRTLNAFSHVNALHQSFCYDVGNYCSRFRWLITVLLSAAICIFLSRSFLVYLKTKTCASEEITSENLKKKSKKENSFRVGKRNEKFPLEKCISPHTRNAFLDLIIMLSTNQKDIKIDGAYKMNLINGHISTRFFFLLRIMNTFMTGVKETVSSPI